MSAEASICAGQAALALAELEAARVGPPIPAERLHDCVHVILSYQNGDGGWATYENTRSYSALEVRLCWRILCHVSTFV